MSPSGVSASKGYDVVVVGAGVIGLSVAWQLARAGRRVVVCDPVPATGASRVAAGMLAPVTEVHFGETGLLGLTLAGAAMWPRFAEELTEASQCDVGYRATGTVVVARDHDDRRDLDRLRTFAETLGLVMEPLGSKEIRAREPLLAPDVRGGLWVPGDHSVDNRALLSALNSACHRAGVEVVHQQVARVDVSADRATGVTLIDTERIAADVVVLAAGAWSRQIGGLEDGVLPPVRPVRGQALRLHRDRGGLGDLPTPRTTVRGLVKGRSVYVVPRGGGEVVVGATSDEVGYEPHATAGSVWELLNDARALLPSLNEMTFVEASAGLRPGTPDNVPLVGRSRLSGLLMATGHYRNGILLAPITAEHIVGLLDAHDSPSQEAGRYDAWDPRRFESATSPQLVGVGESR